MKPFEPRARSFWPNDYVDWLLAIFLTAVMGGIVGAIPYGLIALYSGNAPFCN